MRIIRTNDGLIGIQSTKDGEVKWCKDQDHVALMAYAHYRTKLGHDAPALRSIEKDVDTAMASMTQTGDTVAEFGVLGSFMYTTTEVEYEF